MIVLYKGSIYTISADFYGSMNDTMIYRVPEGGRKRGGRKRRGREKEESEGGREEREMSGEG